VAFLTDSNVLSEGVKPQPDERVTRWLEENESEIVVDSVILGEVRLGVLQLPVGRRRQALEQWFEQTVRGVACLAWDEDTALCWAELLADLRRKGQSMPILDSMIAATARVHGLTMATRNVRDFKAAGLRVVNPFE
jgi:predicted nucleic acid-binding protein